MKPFLPARVKILLQRALVRHRRITRHEGAGLHVAPNTGTGSYHSLIADPHMIADADPAAEADTVADGHASGNPHFAAHNTAFADADIVTDMHMVVDFCAMPNPRGFECGAIDGGAGADHHIIPNCNIAERVDPRQRYVGGRSEEHTSELQSHSDL